MAVKKIGSIVRFLGLSSDTKPGASEAIPIGSTFIETDTRDVYVCYDGTNWTKYKRNSDKDRSAATMRQFKPNETYSYMGG